MKTIGRFFFLLALLGVLPISAAETQIADIVIYGGTSAGVIAAVQASRMGKSVILIEPGKHLGGMTASGLGWVDTGNPALIGGLSREYFHRICEYYQNDAVWIWEKRHLLADQHSTRPKFKDVMYVFEPHVAEQIFDEMISETTAIVIRGERLNREGGVHIDNGIISEIEMESGAVFKGQIFIDATYEGDLMGSAGVSYTVGREPNSLYQEQSNGVLPNVTRGNIPKRVDPFRIKGDPKSGLLPRIAPNLEGSEGEGDSGVQAYNYRMCLTDVPENRVMIEKPENYEDTEYEIVFRVLQAGVDKKTMFKFDRMPNLKTDSNNNGPVSTDYVGMNWEYAEADYATREKIAKAHENWQRGLIWTLQNHPKASKNLRNFFSPWGLAKDEFVDNNNWPYQLYIREARRMIGEVIITEKTVLGIIKHPDGIGLGSYHMDSHAVKYFVASDNFLMTDGCLYKIIKAPYPISYRALLPKREECQNLLVPICLSATHSAYGSVRMEPTLMILAQSAASAACLSLEYGLPLHDLPYSYLRTQLLEDHQILEYMQ